MRAAEPLQTTSRARVARATATQFLARATILVLTAASLAAQAQTKPAANASPAPESLRGALDHYCVTCHNQRLKTAGLILDTVDAANVAEHAELWEQVLRKVESGAMPPLG